MSGPGGAGGGPGGAGECLQEQRRRLQREVQLLEQSLTNTDLTQLSSDESDSEDSEDLDPDQAQSRPGPGSEELLHQRDLLHREIQELERNLGPDLSEDPSDGRQEEPSSSSDESDLELPVSVESCLQMNLVYQEVIQETLEQLDTLLQHNDTQQKELLVQLSVPESKPRGSRPTNLYLGSFLKPYFKDRLTGLGPPSNPETREKNNRLVTSLDESRTRPRRWEGWQKVLLTHAVSRDRLRKLIQPKLSRLDFLTQKLSSASECDKVQISEQIQGLERDIQALREKKEEELFGDRCEDVDWARIANVEFEGSREAGDLQCFWTNYLHPSINKEPWIEDEIRRLKEIALRNQERDWTRTSEELGSGRTAFMCLQTYQRFASQSLRKSSWTKEEDAQLRSLVESMRIGNFIPYTRVSYFMKDRLPGQLIYRWNQVLDPTIKRGPWSLEEDQLLLGAIEKYGAKNWWKIRYEVPGRTDAACRDRYTENLKPDVKKGAFSEQEKLQLYNLVKKHGYGHWAKIAAEIPHRTDAQCMRVCRRLMKDRGEEAPEEAHRRVQRARRVMQKHQQRQEKEAQEKEVQEREAQEKEAQEREAQEEEMRAKKSLRKPVKKQQEEEEEWKTVNESQQETRSSSTRTRRIPLRLKEEILTDEELEELEEVEEVVPHVEMKTKKETVQAPRPKRTETKPWKTLDLEDWTSTEDVRFFRPVLLPQSASGGAVLLPQSASGGAVSLPQSAFGGAVSLPQSASGGAVSLPQSASGGAVSLQQQQQHVMITAEDLSELVFRRVQQQSSMFGLKHESVLYYKLQMAIVPWVGNVVLSSRDLSVPKRQSPPPALPMTTPPALPMTTPPGLPMTTPPGLPMTTPPTLPMTTPPTLPMTTPPTLLMTTPPTLPMTTPPTLPKTRWFQLFLLALKVDGHGCRRMIQERSRYKDKTVATLLRRSKSPQAQPEASPSLSLRPHMYPSYLHAKISPAHPASPASQLPSPAPLRSPAERLPLPQVFISSSSQLAALPPVWPQNAASALAPPSPQNVRPTPPNSPALITVMAPGWIQNVRPASSPLVPVSAANTGQNVCPAPPSLITVMAPGLSQHGRHSPLKNLKAQSSVSPVGSQHGRPPASAKQNVCVFQADAGIHVVRVYASTPKPQNSDSTRIRDQERPRISASDTDTQIVESDHNYTLKHEEASPANQSAACGSSSNQSAGSEEGACPEGKRRRKMTTKAAAQHNDKVERLKKRLLEKKRCRLKKVPGTLAPPHPSLAPPLAPVAPPLVPVAPPLIPRPPPIAPRPPPLAPVAPPSPQTSALTLPELCDWLGAGRHEQELVSPWLRGEGGVAVGGAPVGVASTGGGARLPYLPPFVCNLRALSRLLQQRETLSRDAEKVLPPRRRTGQSQLSNQAAMEELRERLRRMVSEHFAQSPAHQLLRARFLSIFSVPALLASMQPTRDGGEGKGPIGEQQEEQEPIGEQQLVQEPNTKQNIVQGPIGEQQEEQGPIGEQQEEQEPIGEQQEEQEPIGEQQEEQEPIGEQQEEQEPIGEQQEEQEPIGEQ